MIVDGSQFSVLGSGFSAEQLGHCARQIVATDVPMRCYRPDEAARVIDALEPYQARFRRVVFALLLVSGLTLAARG